MHSPFASLLTRTGIVNFSGKGSFGFEVVGCRERLQSAVTVRQMAKVSPSCRSAMSRPMFQYKESSSMLTARKAAYWADRIRSLISLKSAPYDSGAGLLSFFTKANKGSSSQIGQRVKAAGHQNVIRERNR
jgi:hypothetical protein